MNKIQKKFCNNLKKYADMHYSYFGGKNEFAKELKISQGQMSNVLAGRKCGDEEWRRMVAKKIGMDYNAMIGLPLENENGNNVIRFSDAYDKEHYEITKGFINKKLAIKINQGLINIEQMDPDELEEIDEIVVSKVRKLNKKHKKKPKTKKG